MPPATNPNTCSLQQNEPGFTLPAPSAPDEALRSALLEVIAAAAPLAEATAGDDSLHHTEATSHLRAALMFAAMGLHHLAADRRWAA